MSSNRLVLRAKIKYFIIFRSQRTRISLAASSTRIMRALTSVSFYLSFTMYSFTLETTLQITRIVNASGNATLELIPKIRQIKSDTLIEDYLLGRVLRSSGFEHTIEISKDELKCIEISLY